MSHPQREVVAPRRLVAGIGVLVALVAAFDLQAFLPANVVSLPGQRQAEPVVRTLLPQGWAFFTRSPRSPDLAVYALRPDGQVRDIARGAYAEPRHAFGLDRSARAQATELAMLINGVPESSWQPCRDKTEQCLTQGSGPLRPVSNQTRSPSVCGPAVIARTEPVPWAYRDLIPGEVRLTHVVRLEVSC